MTSGFSIRASEQKSSATKPGFITCCPSQALLSQSWSLGLSEDAPQTSGVAQRQSKPGLVSLQLLRPTVLVPQWLWSHPEAGEYFFLQDSKALVCPFWHRPPGLVWKARLLPLWTSVSWTTLACQLLSAEFGVWWVSGFDSSSLDFHWHSQSFAVWILNSTSFRCTRVCDCLPWHPHPLTSVLVPILKNGWFLYPSLSFPLYSSISF